MKTVRETGLLFGRQGMQMLRNPVWMFVGLSTPLLYLLLFTPLLTHVPGIGGSGARAIDGFLPGILALLAFASGASAGFGTIFEIQSGVTERLRVTPSSRLAILLGPILFGVASMFFFDLLMVVVAVPFGFHLHVAGLLVLAVLLALLMVTMAAFSVAMAVTIKEISGFAAVINGLNLPIMLLAGVLLPLSIGPGWLRVLGHFDPL
ncbi:MAG: ABC transporter permease, partial [Acidimicrobiales bacterium]|nr:ABC transporter permease [Acidimicrobiales bacterium]